VRVVLDTNVAVSAMLWNGTPARLLALARGDRIRLCTSAALLDELHGVLLRRKLTTMVARTGRTATELLADYARLTFRVRVRAGRINVARDPDDNTVLACAVAARASQIVSGDDDLLSVGSYRGIEILSPAAAVHRLERG
jgi:putative PIN family toxin of toxin-antitoxin system